jgi:outer membrane protein assembly factor BamB
MGDSCVPELASVASPPQRDLDYYDLQLSEEPLGEGGQTVVYEASVLDSEPPETVAVRQLGNREFDKSVEWGEDGDYEPFFKQTRKWATVDRRERTEPRWSDSEHIVGIVSVGETLPWTALEYMDGGSLADRLNETDGLAIEEAVWIGERLCRGLELAHNNGVAHLDLKPQNILFRETRGRVWDVPKIADWGLARELLGETSDPMEMLSPRYAAPEQFDSARYGRVDPTTDIYQLGAVVYAMLTGEPPYTGRDESVMLDIVKEELPPPPSQRRSELSEELDAVIQTALEPWRSDRYDSIAQFKGALRTLRVGGQLPPVVDQQATTGDSASNIQTDRQTSRGENEIKESDPVTRWAMFGAGSTRRGTPPDHTGYDTPVTTRRVTVDDTITTTKQWQFDTDAPISSSPAVVNGTVYIGSNDGRLYAVDATTGTKHWQFDTSGWVFSSPAVVDDTVYVGSSDKSLYAVDAATGTKQWEFGTSHHVRSSPAVVDSTVYVGSWDDNLYAVDAATGNQEWQFNTSGWVESSPAIVDGTVYVGSGDGSLYAIDAATGNQEWQFNTSENVYPSPAVADGTVYVGSDDCNLYAVDAVTGDHQWQFDTDGGVHSSPVVVDGTVYVGGLDNSLYAVDATTGNKRWQFNTTDWVGSSPAVVDGTVYVGSGDSSLYAVNTVTGTKQWQFDTDGTVWSSPAVVDDTVYVGSRDHSLYAVGEKK